MTGAEGSTPLTRVRRMPERGHYDRDAIDAILDEAIVCHLSWIYQEQPVVIPTLFARVDDHIYFHGSSGSRTLKGLRAGARVCLECTLIDGLVLARSIFHHSINYRSVVVYGSASEIAEGDEKLAALKAFTEKLLPGRWADARSPNDKELRQTTILRLPIDEASAKVRTGDPGDEEADADYPAWTGIIPIEVTRGTPRPIEGLEWEDPLPDYLTEGLPRLPNT
jgi:uncharacterized protein